MGHSPVFMGHSSSSMELGSFINILLILLKDDNHEIVKKNEDDDDTKVESSLIECEQISVVVSSKL